MAIRVSKGQEAPLYYETTQQSRDDHGIRKTYIPPPSPFAPRARDKPLAHLVRSISRAFNRLTLLTDELALALWTTQEPKPQWSYAPVPRPQWPYNLTSSSEVPIELPRVFAWPPLLTSELALMLGIAQGHRPQWCCIPALSSVAPFRAPQAFARHTLLISEPTQALETTQ
ncbi:hypothetical protein BHM03_00045503 [Ensete ventricosum]|nr:hypothetical protein BHM03_00045503 [Ensete ventricosum]